MKKLDTYNCSVNEFDELFETGVYAVSMVSDPAVEKNFVALSKEKGLTFLTNETAMNVDKQIVTGALLVPNQLIYRNNESRGEHYITFSADDIESIHQKMMRNLNIQSTTHEHVEELKGNYLVESWIIENPELDKSKALGFESLEKGTLMLSYKIPDSNYWENYVKNGKVKGFSLEGFFNYNKQEPEEMAKQKNKEILEKLAKTNYSLLKGIAEKLSIEEQIEKDKAGAGKHYLEFELDSGEKVKVSSVGMVYFQWSSEIPDGKFHLSGGAVMEISDGMLIEVLSPADTEEEKKEVEPEKPEAKEEMEAETKTVTIGEADFEVAETVANHISALEKELADLKKDESKKEEELKKQKAEIEKLKKKPTAEQVKAEQSEKREQLRKNYENMTTAEKMEFQLLAKQKRGE